MEKLIPITTVNEIDREKPYTAETFCQAGTKKLAHLTEIKELMESEITRKGAPPLKKNRNACFRSGRAIPHISGNGKRK